MLKNYFKVAYRSLLRHKNYIAINIIGLCLGITCTLVILSWITNELSYDDFHVKSNRIYLVAEKYNFDNSTKNTAITPYPVAALLKSDLSGIKNFVRIDNTLHGKKYIKVNNRIKETTDAESFAYVDSSFFNIFSFKLLKGNKNTCLLHPNSIVISDTKSKEYFGSLNPIGKWITITDVFTGTFMNLQVTGVMEDMPHNSTLQKDYLISMSTADNDSNLAFRKGNWRYASEYTYLLFSKKINTSSIQTLIDKIIKANTDKFINKHYAYYLIPLKDIHLHSDLNYSIGQSGNIQYVYLFAIIAFLTLTIACINYINLTTAYASKRAKEVGLRKVVGAERKQIIAQFQVEALLTTLLAFLIAVIITIIILFDFSGMIGSPITLSALLNYRFLFILLPVLFFTALISGSYPAFYISSYQPAEVLKGGSFGSIGNTLNLRKALVIFQFTVSIILISSSIIVYNQWQFLRNKRLGLTTAQIVTLPVQSLNFIKDYQNFKKELLKNVNIMSISACNKNIIEKFTDYATTYTNNSDQQYVLAFGAVDYDFFKTLNIKILEGRTFSKQFSSDLNNSVIINESAKKLFGFNEALGNMLKIGSNKTPKRVIGIVQDFNFEDLYHKILPMIFFPTKDYLGTVFIKVRGNNLKNDINLIRNTFQKYHLKEPFQYSFLMDSVKNHYQQEQRFFRIFVEFTFCAIFIACLGLFGLVSFMIQQRTKEIGIRKVVGASAFNIVKLVTVDFIKLILIAGFISFPIAAWSLNIWLRDFPYHINVSLWVFVVSGLLTLFVSLVTISFQAIKAATVNPVKSLKYE